MSRARSQLVESAGRGLVVSCALGRGVGMAVAGRIPEKVLPATTYPTPGRGLRASQRSTTGFPTGGTTPGDAPATAAGCEHVTNLGVTSAESLDYRNQRGPAASDSSP